MRALALMLALSCGPKEGPGGGGRDSAPGGEGGDEGGLDGGEDGGEDSGGGEGGVDSGEELPPIALDGECPLEERYGGFRVDSTEDYAVVDGSVLDGVVPNTVLIELVSEGDCLIRERQNPFCDPPCASDEACDLDGTCVPYPRAQDMGLVRITGLAEPVEMEPVEPGYRYFNTSLDNPPFAPEARLQLLAGEQPALDGQGVAPLVLGEGAWVLTDGEALSVAWEAAPEGSGLVVMEVNIDQHGLTPAVLRCEWEDTGEGVVPAALVHDFISMGVTGFPNGKLSRQSADQGRVGEGCYDFVVAAPRIATVRVSGYVPCADDDDCPEGLTCDESIELCL